MNYVFCGAYRELFFALYLKNKGEKVTVITHNKDIKKYCDTANIDCRYFGCIRPGLKSLNKLKTLKERLDKILNEIEFNEEDRFYLLHKQFSYEAFYLIEKISSNVEIYFKDTQRELDRFKPKFSNIFRKTGIKPILVCIKPILVYFHLLIMKCFLKIVLGLDLVFYDVNGYPCFGIDQKFFDKNNIKTILQNRNYDDIIWEVMKKTKINYKEYDNLISDDGACYDIVTYDSVKKIYQKLLGLPIEFAFKRHPNSKIRNGEDVFSESFFKKYDEIPIFIPIELLCNNIRKNVISIFSLSLIGASKIPHLKAISLLELVEWYNESYKKEFKNYLKRATNNRILFPNNFEELKKILLE